MLFWLIVLGYLGMWYLAAGMSFYYHQNRWKSIAESQVGVDRAFGITFGLAWWVLIPLCLLSDHIGFYHPFSNPHNKGNSNMLTGKQISQIIAASVAKTMMSGVLLINTQREGDSRCRDYLVGIVDNNIILIRHGTPFGVKVELLEQDNYRKNLSLDYNINNAAGILRVWTPWNFRQHRLVKKKIKELKVESQRKKDAAEAERLNRKLSCIGISFPPKE